MTFPTYDDIEEPLLCWIFFHGSEVHTGDTYRPLAEFFRLSPSEREEVMNDGKNRSRWENMVQWARNELRKAGYLASSPRGIWKLSDDGVMAAQRIQHKYPQLK